MSEVRLASVDGCRQALVYLCAGTESTYRIRLEKYPEYSSEGSNGWYGGRVLWGHDKDNKEDAVTLASKWVLNGIYPEGHKR